MIFNKMAYSSSLNALFFIHWSLAMASSSSFLLPKENPVNLDLEAMFRGGIYVRFPFMSVN